MNENEYGKIEIADEVIADYVYMAVKSIKGIHSFNASITDTLSKNILGKESKYKGIKVSQDDKDVSVDIYINVVYGVQIPDVAYSAQKKIEKDLSSITEGRKTVKINVHVQGVKLDNEQK